MIWILLPFLAIFILGFYLVIKKDGVLVIPRAALGIGSWISLGLGLELITKYTEEDLWRFVFYAGWVFVFLKLWEKVIVPALDKMQKRIEVRKKAKSQSESQ